MFGRLKYTPAEYYRLGFLDMIAAIEGFDDGRIAELNNVRLTMCASLWAMGSKITPKQLIPLPIDAITEVDNVVSLEQFRMLAKTYKNVGKA